MSAQFLQIHFKVKIIWMCLETVATTLTRQALCHMQSQSKVSLESLLYAKFEQSCKLSHIQQTIPKLKFKHK